MTWAPDADGQANLVWEDGKWDTTRDLRPAAAETIVTVPDAKGPLSATIAVRTKGDFLKTVENVSVTLVSPTQRSAAGS